MSALVLERVSLRVDADALFAPLSLAVDPGTVTSVVGPSGSGKSSLLKFLCGLLPGEVAAQMIGQGTVRIGDHDLGSLPPAARRLGLLFQDPLLFPHLDVAGNLLFGLRKHASRADRSALVEAGLARVGLQDFAHRDPATLSGGQQARVALLRVLLSRPRALLLDEPFSSLDEVNRRRVRDLVFGEAVKQQLPVLLVTHDKDDVAAAGGPVVELRPWRP